MSSTVRNGDVTMITVVPTGASEAVSDWFLVTYDDKCGICLRVTDQKVWGRMTGRTSEQLWFLAGAIPVPPEEWPPEVCAAVAREKLTNA